jgi:hypothetical protein
MLLKNRYIIDITTMSVDRYINIPKWAWILKKCISGVRVVMLHAFTFNSSMLQSTLRFPHKNDVQFVFTAICFVWSWCFIYAICIYLHIMVSHTISIVTRGVSDLKTERLTLHEYMSSRPVFNRVRVAHSLVFWVVFKSSLSVLLSCLTTFWHCQKCSDIPTVHQERFDMWKR